jgi:predicted DNA-binding antitoxin AbrB/MazE fold protein
MTLTVDATYENGVLKLSQPLPLREHEKVRVTLQTRRDPNAPFDSGSATAETVQEPIWERIAALTRDLPAGALDQLPDDLAAEHDHYLYGTPKRA